MNVHKRFCTNDQRLEVAVELEYDESVPSPTLSQVHVSFLLTEPNEFGVLTSPPTPPQTVRVSLEEPTTFDFTDTGMNIRGDCNLARWDSGCGLWLDVFYDTKFERHFEGVALTFDGRLS